MSQITEYLIKLLRCRDEIGAKKYGATLDRKDLRGEEWLQHLTEELLDAAGYAQAAKAKILELEKQLADGATRINLLVTAVRWHEDKVKELEAIIEAKDREIKQLKDEVWNVREANKHLGRYHREHI